MAKPKALIVRAPGTNCDIETKHAFELAGATADVLHINRLLENPEIGKQYQVLCIPGGFSYGDDIAAGRIFANQVRLFLKDLILDYQSNQKLILGICNGFQVLIKSGALFESDEQLATLTWNESGKYDDRWVNLAVGNENCIFLDGISNLYLPIAHAEGKFVAKSQQTFEKLQSGQQLPLCYSRGTAGATHEKINFPDNPNGSMGNVAGMCDPSGRIFGLMPHPERFVDRTQHPHWTREPDLEAGGGLKIFENAVNALS
ncbi:MAG: phosphoribosylformylglycinamidine synthase subunit PurQ [Planctomycetota bacterium]|nr:phosphoribosylformylglycinamidine synthase subunit PurQ [Planctomycetota bacterium]